MPRITVGAGPLTEADVVAVARLGAGVELAASAQAVIARSRAIVEALAGDAEPHYGISTGFGALAMKHIPLERRALLQRSLIRSHAAGSGPEVEREVVRAMMLLRLATLATGHTGVRPQTAAALAGLLNAGLTPVVREFGSLGCSGDLAPLAHVALALLGEGTIRTSGGTALPAADALAGHGLAPVDLAEKEGLALINGTDGMLGQLLLACADLDLLLRTADLSAAMSVEAMLGTARVFGADLQALRPQPGQAVAAANMTALLAGSPIVASHAGPDCVYVQDAYSMRCAPQVAGAARDTLAHARTVAGHELAAAVDNPVVLLDDLDDVDDVDGSVGAGEQVQSNGNFHGAPVAYVLDFLAIPAADVASISERRTDRMLDATRSRGLPPFLADDPGVDSGHMIAQYTQAALVSELKRLAAPASVDSIPSSAMQEDHVSMGWSAARKLRRSVDALTRVLAIELLTAARALELRAPIAPGPATGAVVAALRETVPGPGPDRHLSPEIEAAVEFVRSGAAVAAADATLPAPLR
ncbi:histidine ammonia-lyase [uncultured Jatrophihabitans sp.]|uniref:histidine ammonia-lyase n=1 Tax=uncultured Jatrophihabitans sp. TaxID=1610747 RepID=UPI0035C9F48B